MTLLTTTIFDFHLVVSVLTTSLTTPTPTLSLVKTSLKGDLEIKAKLTPPPPLIRDHTKTDATAFFVNFFIHSPKR